jgi:type I restriction enzyme S subunit
MWLSSTQAVALILQAGDLLFVEGGSREEAGKCAIWGEEIAECVHQNHVIRARLRDETMIPEFAMLWFDSLPGRAFAWNIARTTTGTLFTIPISQFQHAPIPQPPLATQQRLAETLLVALTSCDADEAEAARLRQQADADFAAAVFGG